jgi:hypothetical protein
MSEFERIINDSMMNEVDYIPGYDDGEWPQDWLMLSAIMFVVSYLGLVYLICVVKD